MKQTITIFCIVLSIAVNAQQGSVGIGTNTPQSMLSVEKGLVIDQGSAATGNFDTSLALRFGANSREGIMSKRIAGDGYKGLDLFTKSTRRMRIDSSGNVIIGATINPLGMLHVDGSSCLDGFVTINGTPSGVYALEVFGTGKFNTVRSAGDAYITDDLTVNSDVSVGGNVAVDGNLTVRSGDGIISNYNNSNQLRYYTKTASFTVNSLNAGALSAQTSISFNSNVFNNPPQVMVGQYVSGTGDYRKLLLQVYDVTDDNCNVRIYNPSSASVTADVEWQIICIGN